MEVGWLGWGVGGWVVELFVGWVAGAFGAYRNEARAKVRMVRGLNGPDKLGTEHGRGDEQ